MTENWLDGTLNYVRFGFVWLLENRNWTSSGFQHNPSFKYKHLLNSNETCAPIANPPNSAQLKDTPYHSPKLTYIQVRAVVWKCGEGQIDTQTAIANIFCVGYASREM